LEQVVIGSPETPATYAADRRPVHDGRSAFRQRPGDPAELPRGNPSPAGTLPRLVLPIQIADYDILTAGDRPDVLVAMNPAALKANIGDFAPRGMVIANSDEFTKRNLTKVGYVANRWKPTS